MGNEEFELAYRIKSWGDIKEDVLDVLKKHEDLCDTIESEDFGLLFYYIMDSTSEMILDDENMNFIKFGDDVILAILCWEDIEDGTTFSSENIFVYKRKK